MSLGFLLAKAATDLIGVPFRLHGRDPKIGLDCIGVVAVCLEAVGQRVITPSSYRLRNTSIDHLIGFAELSGLRRAPGNRSIGDVLLTSPGPGQHHLAIAASAETVIHAHVGLGRVVRQPLIDEPPVLARWRLSDSTEVI